MLEDDRIMADVMQRSLRRAGFEIIWAKSGLDALNYLDQAFDLVVSDYHMPKMNGEEFVKRLRTNELNSEVPVIFVTGKQLELDHDQLRRELGVRLIVSKPFGPRHLIQVIQQCLESSDLSIPNGSSLES
ncbi:response regulator [Aporhodopirellula aestuarii]|uniref:Response regulator n=1 Tax=Aporhodopirellula aestuarii TaxID=2950107 RepID=A0ABT0U9F8_9BACT|nr:response regulator [Aporhodopirellula aestuarii]MCM2373602.1 response regulator [Aporhodopirellula aestuarii]